MGWLRDLMSAADPPVPSFGKLALAAKKTTDWPPEFAVRDRSFATLLSRLDRGQDLSWLAERRPVQASLARALGVSPDEIRRALGTGSPSATETRLLRLRDLPAARPLDLVGEALPPGLPAEVLSPSQRALWWVAPSGAGRTLAGRWLAARGRATFVELNGVVGAEELEEEGPLFVEVGSAGLDTPLRARPGLCVAAPFLPLAGEDFELVRSPELSNVLPALLAWAVERLPSDTRVQVEAAQPVLLELVQAGAVDSFGSLLGLIGVIDEFGPRELRTKPLDRTAQRVIEARISRVVDPSLPFAAWLRRSTYAALLGVAERVLVDSELPLDSPRSFEAWLELVPPELERNVDLEWMRLSLSQIDTTIRPSDIERAARRLPPGAFRITTSLEQAQLLRRDASDQLRLEPCWLRMVLNRTAVHSLLGRSPFEWGEALLRPHAAAEVAEALLARTLREGGSVLEPVLDLEAGDQPAYAAACDLALRTAGVARLLGVDFDEELLHGLWEEAAQLVLDLGDGPPLPRVELRGAGLNARHSRGEALLMPGTFYLAVLSISEVLDDLPDSRLSALSPWQQTSPSPALAPAYDQILSALSERPAWRRAALLLASRARSVVGNVLGAETPHPIELPAQIVDEIQHGVLSFATLEAGGLDANWLEPVLALAEDRGVAEAEIARAIWSCWQQAGRPDGARFLAPDAAEHRRFWAHVPGELLEHLLIDARRHSVPYNVFQAEQWQAFAAAIRRYPELMDETTAWAAMPSEEAAELLASPLEWAVAPRSLGLLWRRFPDLLLRAIRNQLAAGPQADPHALGALLASVPPDSATTLLDEIEQNAERLPLLSLNQARKLLHRLVAGRAGEWRRAYQVLSKLERELNRLR